MAITTLFLQMLTRIRPDLPARASLLSLGYPDILADEASLATAIGADRARDLPALVDSVGIARWHGLDGRLPRIVESAAFFEALAIDCTVIDIHASRGGERIVDLNGSLPDDLAERFDLVLDPGTLEHCFNIGCAIVNVARAVAVGGYVCHFSPMSMFNHGFYNLNPTFFHDFYTQNGFEIALLKGCVGDPLSAKTFDIPATGRFTDPPPDASLVVVAKRMRAGESVWPTQSKYLANPDLTVS
jgi:SAM-dependent methyltransferase